MWTATALLFFLPFQGDFAEKGMKALDEKHYQDAADNFTRAIAAVPTDYTLHFNLALAYSLQGKDAEAIGEYKKTLELKPDLYQADLNLGITLLRQKKSAEALPYFTAAAGQKPKEYRPNYYLGAALLGAGDFTKAEQAYTTALAIDPKSPDAELGLAHALAKQNRLDAAAAHFQKAAELNPNYRDDLLELASLYENAKQPAEAIAIYQQFPENPGAQERLGSLLLESGQPADAIAHFQAAIAKSPTEANRAALATAYIKNKEPDKALPVVEQILAGNPNDFELRMLHGRIVRDQRKFPEAARDFSRAAQLKPDSAEAWSELAGVLVMAEDYPNALGALDRLTALHAEKPGHVYLRAIVLDKVRDLKPALESYQLFLAVSNGQNPDEEFQARQRVRILEREIGKK
jgi:tetratricopeptide (TPR) repeat protein